MQKILPVKKVSIGACSGSILSEKMCDNSMNNKKERDQMIAIMLTTY